MYHTDVDNFTTKDYEFNTNLLYRKGVSTTHFLKFHHFLSNVDTAIVRKNPNYLFNGSNSSGSYSKITYQFTKENRDYVEYPLNGSYLHIEGTKYFKGSSPVDHFELLMANRKTFGVKKPFFYWIKF